MTNPPPPPYNPTPPPAQDKPPSLAWLIPLAGVLALIGGVTPWFRPEFTGTREGSKLHESAQDSLHSWDDGKIGLIGPILLVLLGAAVVAVMLGRTVSRFHRSARGPVQSVALSAIIAGAITIVTAIIAWFILPSQYKFQSDTGNLSWDDFLKAARAAGFKDAALSHGPKAGYFLTIAAGAIALIAGVLVLAMHKKAQAVAGSAPSGQVAGGYPPPVQQGFDGAPQQGYAPPPQQGYAPPAQSGYAPPAQQGYAPPAQSGYAPPAQSGYAPPAQQGYAPPAQPGYASPPPGPQQQ